MRCRCFYKVVFQNETIWHFYFIQGLLHNIYFLGGAVDMFLPEVIILIERTRRKMYQSNDPSKILKISQEIDRLLNRYYSLKGNSPFSPKDK